jgi:hypothetical protein
MKLYAPKKENIIKLEIYLNKIKNGGYKNIGSNTSNESSKHRPINNITR